MSKMMCNPGTMTEIQPIKPGRKALLAAANRITPFLYFRSREQVFNEFPVLLEKIEGTSNRIRSFLRGLPAFKLELRNIRKPPPPFQIEERPPVLAFPMTDLARLGDAELLRGTNEALGEAALRVIEQIPTTLEIGRERQIFGAADYPAEGLARFYDYSYVVEDKVTGVRNSRDKTETDTTRSFVQTLTKQELREAMWHSPHDRTVARKEIVDAVIETIPDVILPFVKIINGIKMFSEVTQRELHSETRTDVQHHPQPRVVARNVNKPDPALVLFDYVLISWD